MKARDISGQAPGGSRTRLAAVLPLATPFVVQVFPVYACNFRCGYCIFSVERSRRHFISDRPLLDLGLWRRCVDDMAGFPDRIKVLRFVGIGEPLLHRDIAAMVRCAAERGVAHTVEILTNGSLLTPAMSDALLAAGLTRLVVSLQGTSREKYRQVCGAEIDFAGLVENLRYFHAHKGGAQMYLKIVDCALDGEEDRRRFYETFGDICDTIAVEHAVPIHRGVDFEAVLKRTDGGLTQFGLPVQEVQICPQPFFHMQINPDGKVVPCYSFEYPGIMGDCNEQSVREIWNGPRFQEFRRRMLDGAARAGATCASCSIIKYRLFPEDALNDDAERLKALYAPADPGHAPA